ncbi:hypothetical protein DSO57_1025704 [Entomophthora muscae]|uniref:Uncharacterized protein n=1 Tax=Entomophthora muscae TaxID=34485 RepID=A0ACC2UC68_9FUNG|nr:hypothetical protein DSO57_1025704 [Entomophthora muscae]
MRPIFTGLFIFFIMICLTWAALPTFCKCKIGSNSAIIPLDNDKDCTSCTPLFCVGKVKSDDKKGDNKETTSTECFQRESYKDKSIVIIFLILTLGLLLSSFLKPYFIKTFGTN